MTKATITVNGISFTEIFIHELDKFGQLIRAPQAPISITIEQATNGAEDVDHRPNHKRPYNKGRGTAAIKRAAKRNRRKK